MAMAVLIFGGVSITAVLSQFRSRTALVLMGGAALSAFIFIQEPQLSALTQLSPLHLEDWLIAGLGGVFVSLPVLCDQWACKRSGRRTIA